MPLIELIVIAVVVAVVTWYVNSPRLVVPAWMKLVYNVLVLIFIIWFIGSLFGVWGSLGSLHVGK